MTDDTPTVLPTRPSDAAVEPLPDAAATPHASHAPAAAPEAVQEAPLASVHASPRPPTEVSSAPNTTPLLGALAVLALIVVIGDVLTWRNTSSLSAQLAQSQSQVAALEGRIGALESRPQPQPPPDLRPLQQRLTALEQKPPPQAQLDSAGQQQIAALSGRIDGIAARQDQLGTREQQDTDKAASQIAALGTQVAALATQVTAANKTGGEINQLADRQTRAARLQSAAVALAAGRPLGDIPGAPPALARFASKPPPTEASLRLSFDAAAQDAKRAGQPSPATTPFLQRIWDRAQASVTIRQGDRIVVGDPLAGIIETARRHLDAGDVAGAVSALDGLAGPAAAAMAPWRADAQSLLDARSALMSAAHG
jgi:hypothetical protein